MYLFVFGYCFVFICLLILLLHYFILMFFLSFLFFFIIIIVLLGLSPCNLSPAGQGPATERPSGLLPHGFPPNGLQTRKACSLLSRDCGMPKQPQSQPITLAPRLSPISHAGLHVSAGCLVCLPPCSENKHSHKLFQTGLCFSLLAWCVWVRVLKLHAWLACSQRAHAQVPHTGLSSLCPTTM